MLRALALAALVALTACGADRIWADDQAVMQARYVAPEPRSVTLFTVISERGGNGAHSSLLINGSEQVLFDPAGSMKMSSVPERHDVLYGMTPRMVNVYIDYHVRPTFRLTEQTRIVSDDVAELILARVKANGSVPKAHCANSISGLLHDIPGFEDISQTYSPLKLSQMFGAYPNVSMRMVNEQTVDHSHGVRFIDPKRDHAPVKAGL
jgi:hypothetical protein